MTDTLMTSTPDGVGGDYFRLGAPVADAKAPAGPIRRRWFNR